MLSWFSLPTSCGMFDLPAATGCSLQHTSNSTPCKVRPVRHTAGLFPEMSHRIPCSPLPPERRAFCCLPPLHPLSSLGSPPGLFHAFFFGSDLPNVVYLYNFCSIFLQIEQIAAQHLILNCKSSILSFAINFFICSSLKGMVLKCQTILLLLSLFLIA